MNKRKMAEAGLEAQINPKEVARKMRGEQTIADIDARSDDEEDGDWLPEGGKDGNDDADGIQRRLVRPATLRPTDKLEDPADHDPFLPHLQQAAAQKHREPKKRAQDPKLQVSGAETMQTLQQYRDKIGHYSHLDHNDTKRPTLYPNCPTLYPNCPTLHSNVTE